MTKKDRHIEMREKVLKGLEIAYERLIQFKKEKKSELVIMKDGKVISIKPE